MCNFEVEVRRILISSPSVRVRLGRIQSCDYRTASNQPGERLQEVIAQKRIWCLEEMISASLFVCFGGSGVTVMTVIMTVCVEG